MWFLSSKKEQKVNALSFNENSAMCDSWFSTYDKGYEIKSIVEEYKAILRKIHKMGEFFKSFEERIRLEKEFIEDKEAQEEVEEMVKEYKAVMKHRESFRYPTLEQLMDVEKKLFEIKNIIQRGNAYNFLLNRKYDEDFEKRKENIRKLKEKQNVDNNTVWIISPQIEERTSLRFCNRNELEKEQEEMINQNNQLTEENTQLKEEVKLKTAEISEL
jgi:hypothetical protein